MRNLDDNGKEFDVVRLSVGAIFRVIEMHGSTRGPATFRVYQGKTESPGIFPTGMFELATNTIPSCWRVATQPSGYVELAPDSWLRDGFWDDFFDGRPQAKYEFHDAIHLMEVEEPMPEQPR
jgi:hypothetical protein